MLMIVLIIISYWQRLLINLQKPYSPEEPRKSFCPPRGITASNLTRHPADSILQMRTRKGKLDTVNTGREEEIDAQFEQISQAGSPGCALGVISGGELIYKRGYGLANLEYDIPITPSTVFDVASMSKQFTAMAALLLAEKGQISLADEISRHVPDCPDSAAGITVRLLIHHTSGLRSDLVLLLMAGWRLEDVITNDDVIRLFKRQKNLNFSPGEHFSYSGTGYLVLASIIEHVSGQSLNMFCGEQIFKPLGMENTHFHDDYLKIVKNRAYAYYLSKEGSYSKAVLTCGLVGGTGLFTTIEDLFRWDENFYSGVVGGPSVIRQMHQPGLLNSGEKVDYACGLIIDEFEDREVFSHGDDCLHIAHGSR